MHEQVHIDKCIYRHYTRLDLNAETYNRRTCDCLDVRADFS